LARWCSTNWATSAWHPCGVREES